MCIAYLALGSHPDWPLLIAANRDEFHQRPTLPAAPWTGHPQILSGLDLQAGGTWLGITTSGRFALVTNYREPGAPPPASGDMTRSRGELSSQFLTGSDDALSYLNRIADQADRYRGFNLIVGDQHQAAYLGNRDPAGAPRLLPSGRYVLSNHLLDTAWPKSERLRHHLEQFPDGSLSGSLTPVFTALRDTTPAQDPELPDTGLPLERERLLSSIFITDPGYGTRSSTVIAVRADGQAFFGEQTFGPRGVPLQRHDWPFRILPQALN